ITGGQQKQIIIFRYASSITITLPLSSAQRNKAKQRCLIPNLPLFFLEGNIVFHVVETAASFSGFSSTGSGVFVISVSGGLVTPATGAAAQHLHAVSDDFGSIAL